MKNSVVRSIIDNTFLPNYEPIFNYFQENNFAYNNEDKIDGGFTLNFGGFDSKKLFKRNLQTQPEDWYYRTHEVKYTLNSLGYRTKEFDDIDWKESIVVFGCSYIFGIGVSDEHTVPYFLEQLFGRPVINMGVAGSSIQTVLHNSIILNDYKYPTPKAVVNMITELHRYQVYKDDFVHHIGKWSYSSQQFEKKENIIPFNLMNVKMIRNLWKNKTIYYEGTMFPQEKLINKLDEKIYCEFLKIHNRPFENHWGLYRDLLFKIYNKSFENDRGLARDLIHKGPVKNLEIAKCIHKKLKLRLKN